MKENTVATQHPVILLHGWGFSSLVWQPLIKAFHAQGYDNIVAIDLPGFASAFHEPCTSLQQTLDFIIGQLPEKSVLCGWSLGGMLATSIAIQHPEKVAALVTIGSNLRFTAQEHFTALKQWPGMPAEDYRQFCDRFSAQPQKTWQRFLALQTRGDSDVALSSAALDLLADYSSLHTQTAGKMLALLDEIDNRDGFANLTVPGLHILADNDAITPVAIAPFLKNATNTQQVNVWHGCGHAIPVSRATQLASTITGFLSGERPDYLAHTATKPRIADSFSRAANTYNQAAVLQRDIGKALLAAMPENMAGTIVDMGCGTGFISGELLKKKPANTQLVALDFASGMLAQTRTHHSGTLCVQADMESLPFADNTADWLVSNLALQWVNTLLPCFLEWRRVLKPGGQLFFTTFLPGTLRELELSWRHADNAVHVNPFIAQATLLQALHVAGFTQVDSVPATHTLYYPDANALAHELKAIGAHNMNTGQPIGLTGTQRWKKMYAAYECLRTDRGLPASYEVLYVSAG